MTVTALHGLVATGVPASMDSTPAPNPLVSYTALPSSDPDDGKFMAVAGSDLSTLGGIAVVFYVGIPAGGSNFEVGIFDGDTGNHWDSASGPPDDDTVVFKLFRDPLKNGTSGSLLSQWTSTGLADDDWTTKTFSTDAGARAPSGNYFYRLEVNWESLPRFAFNNFKVRTTGQISLRAGQAYGFDGGPQIYPTPDPCVGTGDPNPGDTNDPGANSYNGDWSWYFYVPTVLTSISFTDGDFDHRPNGAPQDDNLGSPCVLVPPDIYYTVTDPQSHVFTDATPSGDQVWKDFTIGPNSGDDVHVNYTLQPGLWRLHVIGMDAHNFVLLRASREVYSNGDPPLTVNPTPLLEPNHDATTRSRGVTMEYGHNVTNRGAPDSFDLKATSAHAWATRIYHDTNGNGKRDAGEAQVTQTPTLGTNEAYPIVVQVDVPTGAPPKVDDVTTVLASSRNEWALQDDASDTTHVLVNRPPVPDAGGPYVSSEGTAITFDASGSTDPDGDALQFRWDFQADGTWDTPWASSPTATFTFGDDWSGKVRLEVTDGTATVDATQSVSVTNVAPSIQLTVIPSGNEADVLTFSARVTDPGSDDLTFAWNGSCSGWSAPTTYLNDPAVGPDPHPSPTVNPRNVTDSQTVVCGDNGAFAWSLKITDDDGGVTTASGSFAIGNLPPSLAVSPPAQVTVDEGTQVSLTATASDRGSDDLAFAWSWQYFGTDARTYFNDGVGPDPANSPNGTFPFTVTDTSSWMYGDNGDYTAQLVVSDDDGGTVAYTTTITVRNVPPTVTAGADRTVDEASPVAVQFAFTDPGFDQPSVPSQETFTATIDWGYGPIEGASVAWVTGSPGVPSAGTVDAMHVYGDNGAFRVTATVCDDDGGCGSASLTVTVNNVAPTITDVQVYVVADLTLRVAGEKWHDVRMDIVWNNAVTASAHVVRYPGSPDRQTGTITGGRLQLLGTFSIVLYYTPADDPVNGQANGANPVWVILTLPDGSEVRLHHTFNVQHPSTWVWSISDVRPYLVGQPITFDATAHDVGSDDLTFTWTLGDGSPAIKTTFYNNGVSPDPYISPEVNPITANDVHTHAFAVAGTYSITLAVMDDDGGVTARTFVLEVG